GRSGPQAWSEPGSLGERHRVDLARANVGGFERLSDERRQHLYVVVRGLPGVDSSRRREVEVGGEAEDLGVLSYDAHRGGVRRRLDAEDDHRPSTGRAVITPPLGGRTARSFLARFDAE